MKLTKSQSAHLYQMMQRFIGFFSAMRHRMNVLHVDETDPFYIAVTSVINALQWRRRSRSGVRRIATDDLETREAFDPPAAQASRRRSTT